ncbi:phospholipid-transporting ATPase ABCA3-like [Physella acuta]|uniref:phospholipid-transporting ATPase ABCA3-like n=1 Tax=Physella acuta TaxID=109671 RepID=UPI0027DE0712|nr:phospholipid-transporting ATPase ABCA3-like [Physella acuta]
MGLSQQFFALLWKNWKIKYRSWGSILAELIFPLLLSILIFYTHYDQTVDHTERTVTFDPLWSNYRQEPIFVGTPSSSAIETLVRSQMTGKYSAVHMFPTVEQATEFSRTLRWPNISTPVVSFELDDVTTVPHHLKFKLNVAFNYYPNEIYGEALWLNLYSVPETMHGVTMMFINHWQTQKGGPPSHLRLELVEMPKLVTKQSNSSLVHLSMTYGLLFMALFCFTTITIVDERESKIKESMKLMGLGELIYWMSWFVMNFIYGLYICILGWVVMCVDYSPVGRLLKSSSLLFAIFELVFTVNTISAAFLLGTFFKRGRLAGIISIIVYFAIPMATSSLIEQKTARILLYGVFLYRFGFEVARQVLYDNENMTTKTLKTSGRSVGV